MHDTTLQQTRDHQLRAHENSPEECAAAARCIARHARNTADELRLLDAIGITPDDIPAATCPTEPEPAPEPAGRPPARTRPSVCEERVLLLLVDFHAIHRTPREHGNGPWLAPSLGPQPCDVTAGVRALIADGWLADHGIRWPVLTDAGRAELDRHRPKPSKETR